LCHRNQQWKIPSSFPFGKPHARREEQFIGHQQNVELKGTAHLKNKCLNTGLESKERRRGERSHRKLPHTAVVPKKRLPQ